MNDKSITEILFLCQINALSEKDCDDNILWQKRAQKDLPFNVLMQKVRFPSYTWKKYYLETMTNYFKILKIYFENNIFELYIHPNDTLFSIISRSLYIIYYNISDFNLKQNFTINFFFNDNLTLPSNSIIENLQTSILNNWNQIENPKIYIISNGNDISLLVNESFPIPTITNIIGPQVRGELEEREETDECCICMDEHVPRSDLLTCQHPVCGPCLSQLRNPYCPLCKSKLEGPNVTSELLADIINREEQELLNNMTTDYLVSEYLDNHPGVNPEEVYNMFR